MDPRISQLEREVAELKYMLFTVFKSDKFYFNRKLYLERGMEFSGDFALTDGTNLTTGTATGSKIGGSATSKVGLYDATPVIQAAAIANPSGGGTSITDAIDISGRSKLGEVLTALRNLGAIDT